MSSWLQLIGRSLPLFETDTEVHRDELDARVGSSRILVIGGAGSIGQAVVREIFRRGPKALHVVDLSENNLVELVRDLRSSIGYIDGDFRTFAIDCGSIEFELLHEREGPYDIVCNLSALKHVRSESDPYTLMRMTTVNVLNTVKTLELARDADTERYFAVSTDKAANPVNMMGASKRIMEMCLTHLHEDVVVSTARFANVAFSDGSLLHGFTQRLAKRQPIAAPEDVLRYFLTFEEAGRLCLLSAVLGRDGDIFFPSPDSELTPTSFRTIAEQFLQERGLEPVPCATEDEARAAVPRLHSRGQWPCYFFASDTTGEKDLEEFHTESETVDRSRFAEIGIVQRSTSVDVEAIEAFLAGIRALRDRRQWQKADLLDLYRLVLPDFAHAETGKYLDNRM